MKAAGSYKLGYKRCSMCKAQKSVDEFSASMNSSDGKQNNCKECQRIHRNMPETKARNLENKARYNQQRAERRAAIKLKNIGIKCCPMCKEMKAPSEFYLNKCRPNGIGTYCKECDQKRRMTPEALEYKLRREHSLGQSKRCSRCEEWKPLSEFHKDHTRQADGYSFVCRACHSVYSKETRKRLLLQPGYKEKIREQSRRSRLRGLEKDPDGYRRRHAENHKAWIKKNPEKHKATIRRYIESENGKQKIKERKELYKAEIRWMKETLIQAGFEITGFKKRSKVND